MHSAVPFVREAILDDALVLAKNMRKIDKLEIKYSHNVSPIAALMQAFQTTNGKNYSVVDDDGYVYACLLYPSDAADEEDRLVREGRRNSHKKTK